jgi:hypothetical protein
MKGQVLNPYHFCYWSWLVYKTRKSEFSIVYKGNRISYPKGMYGGVEIILCIILVVSVTSISD